MPGILTLNEDGGGDDDDDDDDDDHGHDGSIYVCK
jgi:hypothetical protein